MTASDGPFAVRFPCPACGWEFWTETERDRHIRTFHQGAASPSRDAVAEVRRSRVKAAWADIGLMLIPFVVFAVETGGIEHVPGRYEIMVEGWPAAFYFVLVLAYFFFCEVATGQTLGKRWFGVRVTQSDGGPPSLKAIALRTVLRLVDWLPAFYVSGYISIRQTKSRAQRLGDRAAGTTVTSATGTAAPNRVALPVAIASLVLVAIATLGAAVAQSKHAEAAFITRADAVCSRFSDQSISLSVRLNSADSPSEAARPLLALEELSRNGFRELAVLDAPGSVDAAWNRYMGLLSAQIAALDVARSAAERGDLGAYQQAMSTLRPIVGERVLALKDHEFNWCG